MDIKNILAKILLVFIIATSAMLPMVSFASSGGATYKTPSIWPTGYWGPIVWCTGDYLPNAQQPNQQVAVNGSAPAACTNLCDLIGTAINVIYLLMSIALFFIAPVLMVWGGVTMMFAGANPGSLETGKKILTGTVIGIAIVLCSYLLINTVLGALQVTAIGGFNGNSNTCSIQ
ncbi:MAG: hypothetical protein ABR884_04115 [Minisyncoccia bacterium]|jgi:hypothetical protein